MCDTANVGHVTYHEGWPGDHNNPDAMVFKGTLKIFSFGYSVLKELPCSWESDFVKSWSSVYLCPLADHPTSLTSLSQSVKWVNSS